MTNPERNTDVDDDGDDIESESQVSGNDTTSEASSDEADDTEQSFDDTGGTNFDELDFDPESPDPFDELNEMDEPSSIDPFEEIQYDDEAIDNVWELVLGSDTAVAETADFSSATGPDADMPPGAETVETATETEHEEHIVNKRKYCQLCEYFSDPPDVSCSHPGTEILEVTDSDQFRVKDCPMIAKGGPEISTR